MLQQIEAEYHVERAVLVGQRLGGLYLQPDVPVFFQPVRDRLSGDIGAGDIESAAAQLGDDTAYPAAEFEYPLAGLEHVQTVEELEVGLEVSPLFLARLEAASPGVVVKFLLALEFVVHRPA